jgi:copper chaperone CopZ
VPGIISYNVDLKTDSAIVDYDAAKVTAGQIAEAVAEVGYKAREVVEVK